MYKTFHLFSTDDTFIRSNSSDLFISIKLYPCEFKMKNSKIKILHSNFIVTLSCRISNRKRFYFDVFFFSFIKLKLLITNNNIYFSKSYFSSFNKLSVRSSSIFASISFKLIDGKKFLIFKN